MNIIEKILNETKYEKYNGDKKVISCSSLGGEPLQIYYGMKYDIEDEFNQSTLGTLVHIGLENIFGKQERLVSKSPIYRHYYLTGLPDYVDWKNETIWDFKVTKTYTGKKIREDPFNHQYSLQLNGYRYLLQQLYPNKNFDMKLLCMYKDGGTFDYKINRNIDYEIISIPFIPDSEIEKEVKYIIDNLEDTNEGCKDKWWGKANPRSKNSKEIPKRCELYCKFKTVCKWYNEYYKED